jgi:hypothetical protein
MPSHPRKSPVKKPSNKPNAGNYVERSSLYREFLAEREEILRHKWIESEKLGRDIGFERALLDWIRMHRDKWRASRRNEVRQRARSRA